MLNTLKDTIHRSWPAQVAVGYFVPISIWWFTIFFRGLSEGFEPDLYTNIYGLLALWGGIWGLVNAQKWGGFKSLLGRSLSMFSLGLLAQFFGQITYNTAIYLFHIELPYPSIGDIGYFGSVLFYIYAIMLLSRVVGMRVKKRPVPMQIIAILIPVFLLIGSALVFLRGYEFDWSAPLTMLLDFGYPLGQAVYVSLALMAALLTRDVLGGLMRAPMSFLLLALVFQYFCDYIFLYQAYQGTWHVANVNDYMYFVSYLLMTLALIQLGVMFARIRES